MYRNPQLTHPVNKNVPHFWQLIQPSNFFHKSHSDPGIKFHMVVPGVWYALYHYYSLHRLSRYFWRFHDDRLGLASSQLSFPTKVSTTYGSGWSRYLLSFFLFVREMFLTLRTSGSWFLAVSSQPSSQPICSCTPMQVSFQSLSSTESPSLTHTLRSVKQCYIL